MRSANIVSLSRTDMISIVMKLEIYTTRIHQRGTWVIKVIHTFITELDKTLRVQMHEMLNRWFCDATWLMIIIDYYIFTSQFSVSEKLEKEDDVEFLWDTWASSHIDRRPLYQIDLFGIVADCRIVVLRTNKISYRDEDCDLTLAYMKMCLFWAAVIFFYCSVSDKIHL